MAIIGVSNANPGSAGKGIVAPQNDGWLITNARFYNWQNGGAALGDCSQCSSDDFSVGGAFTTKTSNLMFDTTVTKRISFGSPAKGIFHDLDGTLTDVHS